MAASFVKLYWLTNKYMTIGVRVENDVIVETPPVIKRFRGQHLANLIGWMQNMDPAGFRMEKV
jgi:hypothetical protein